MAGDESLSPSERIGFPDEYREGAEEAILADIVRKVPALSRETARILDIGPGSSELARKTIEHCTSHGYDLVMVDSEEMLSRLPDAEGLTKVAARFPEAPQLLAGDPFDGVIVYSVLQHVFVDGDLRGFVEAATGLLAHGGTALFGDVPNGSKLRRFLSSPAGAEFHRAYSGRDEDPDLEGIEEGRIDDELLLELIRSARGSGLDAYLLPQPDALPMANRREDLLVYKP